MRFTMRLLYFLVYSICHDYARKYMPRNWKEFLKYALAGHSFWLYIRTLPLVQDTIRVVIEGVTMLRTWCFKKSHTKLIFTCFLHMLEWYEEVWIRIIALEKAIFLRDGHIWWFLYSDSNSDSCIQHNCPWYTQYTGGTYSKVISTKIHLPVLTKFMLGDSH